MVETSAGTGIRSRSTRAMRLAWIMWLWMISGDQDRTRRISRTKPRGSGKPRPMPNDSVGMPRLRASRPMGPSGVRDTMNTSWPRERRSCAAVSRSLSAPPMPMLVERKKTLIRRALPTPGPDAAALASIRPGNTRRPGAPGSRDTSSAGGRALAPPVPGPAPDSAADRRT